MTLSKRYAKYRALVSAILLSLFAILAAGQALAWSEGGHVAIAELALRDLNRQQRRELNGLARVLVNAVDGDRLAEGYGSLSAVSRTAAWVDGLRSLTVTEIFTRYGHELPPELRLYARSTTADWHYSNLPYFDEPGEADYFQAHCSLENKGELNRVLPLLQQAFASAADARDKAILLAMLVHFVGDAHQPLHGITRVTDGCRHDRGGNGFCVASRGSRNPCETNLHRIWDSGFGGFRRRNFQSTMAAIAALYSRSASNPDAAIAGASAWQRENLALAEFIYSTEERGIPSGDYYRQGVTVVQQRAALAARRLGHLLATLADRELRQSVHKLNR